MKVKLLKDFWGHKAGTKGTVKKGKLYLRGSPPATVTTKDEGTLYGPRKS